MSLSESDEESEGESWMVTIFEWWGLLVVEGLGHFGFSWLRFLCYAVGVARARLALVCGVV